MASLGSTANKSVYSYKVMFQKCLYFNQFLFVAWIIVIGFILAAKVNYLEKLTIYLSVTIFTLLVVLEAVRIAIGQIAIARNRIPEMGGFLLMTNLMQLPLVSFFLFNPYLKNLPVETILNGSLWTLSIMEAAYGYKELKRASASAANIYYGQLQKDIHQTRDDKMKTKS